MGKKEAALESLLKAKLLPLYYDDSVETSIEILRALYNGGIKILEYTNRGQNALSNFKKLKRVAVDTMPSLFLGIGTIKTKYEAEQFIEAGADFIVCPSIDPEVGKVAQKADLLWIPGCMTTTEIATAEQAGATLVKIFPGNILGPEYIDAIKDIFPKLKFMPTGGVEANKENLEAWFKSGVIGVGMGSKLITKEILKNKDYKKLEETTKQVLELVNSCHNAINK